MATSPDFPRLRFRLVLGRSIAVGPGKAELLAAIAATGSITAAGQSMGMSYKQAWYLLDTTRGTRPAKTGARRVPVAGEQDKPRLIKCR